MGLVPHEELVNSAAPFADAARYMFSGTAGTVASILSIIACFGSISGWLILQSEGPRAGAKPVVCSLANSPRCEQNDVPMKSLIFTGVLMSPAARPRHQTWPNSSNRHSDVCFRILLPYMYALDFLPIIMVSKMNRGSTFISITSRWLSAFYLLCLLPC